LFHTFNLSSSHSESDDEDDFLDEFESSGGASGEDEDNFGEEAEEERQEAEEPHLAKLSISREHAANNYRSAGTELPEEPTTDVKREDFEEVMDPAVEALLDDLVNEINLPYKLTNAQRIACVALATNRSVVMVTPTGSGKMTVPLLAAHLLRRIQNRPKGIVVVTQPLTGLMMEQLKSDICDVAILSMSGSLVTDIMAEQSGEESEGERDARLSCDMRDLMDGKYQVLVCHPESASSPLGQRILGELKRNDQLLMVCIDEFHVQG
jgi:hypothetical protein